MGGIAVWGSSEGASRRKRTSVSGWFGSRPEIRGLSPKFSRDDAVAPAGQRTPGTAWHDAQPTRSMIASPSAGFAPASVRGGSLLSPQPASPAELQATTRTTRVRAPEPVVSVRAIRSPSPLLRANPPPRRRFPGTVTLGPCCAGVRALSSALSLFALAACHPIANDTEAALTASGELVALSGGGAGARNACFSCHGLDGLGDGDSVPRLAGMEVGYLQKQMEDYARALRHDAVMSPIARRLSEGDRRAVVAWYAAMPAPAGAAGAAGIGTPAPILFAQGDPARGVVACAACHGDEGQGAGPGNPALAGQPAAYTLEQLTRWKRA